MKSVCWARVKACFRREPTRCDRLLFRLGCVLTVLLAAAFPLLRRFAAGTGEGWPFPCFFYALTGLYCPACGGTRAVRALLRGEWVTAFRYHALVPVCAFFGIVWMLLQALNRLTKGKLPALSWNSRFLYLPVGLLLLTWIWHNAALLAGYPL